MWGTIVFFYTIIVIYKPFLFLFYRSKIPGRYIFHTILVVKSARGYILTSLVSQSNDTFDKPVTSVIWPHLPKFTHWFVCLCYVILKYKKLHRSYYTSIELKKSSFIISICPLKSNFININAEPQPGY